MNVLHVVASLALRHGGVSVSVRELCRGLAAAGVTVQIWTTDRAHDLSIDGPADERLRAAGVEVHYAPVHPWRWLGLRYGYSPALRAALTQAIPQAELVHLHGLWLYPTTMAAGLCRRAGVPYILSPCGALDPYGLARHRLLKWGYALVVERRTLAGAALLHCTSAQERRHVTAYGITAPIFVVPRASPSPDGPTPPPGAFRQAHPEVGAGRLVVFIGRLHPKKRLDLVVETFAAAAQRYSDLHLVVAGPDDGAGGPARRQLAAAGVADRATFLGLVAGAQKQALLREGTLFLLPSEDENFGVSVIEAMAAGLPVVVSPSVGVADAVARSGAGLVVDAASAAWASAAERVLADPAVARAMGEAGRRAAAEFSPAQVVGAMRAAYGSLAQRRPS
ncbi:MAG: hypothetical protein A3C53_03230 [Omnitrophica WOR_2 bacterium RIFCSPHIGHO2_02_FULL_68_15]|nr:MAG: hypothetical protein A3C53_03230 [Omnitrophica WOR_2 bacterium RIFCSPHIGHO2_02_FULL_68_15]